MYWRNKWDSSSNNVTSTQEAVRNDILNSVDYHAGSLETLRAQVGTMAEWVAQVVAYLPDDVQREIVPLMTAMVEDKE